MGAGRQRDSRVDAAIADATREVLAEVGYPQLTVDEVARRAAVGKAAIYRRYASRAEMVFAAALGDLDIVPAPDGGSLRADLAALVGRLIDAFGAPGSRQALPGLLGELLADPGLAERFRTGLLSRVRLYVIEVLDRAVDRGELGARPDPQLVYALLLGPVFAALFLVKLDPADLPERLAAVVGGAFGPSTTDVPETRRVVPANVAPAW